MKISKYILFGCSLVCFNAYPNTNLDNCLAMAKEMNKQLPRKIDFTTTLEATSCLEDKGKVFFQYVHTINDPGSLPQNIEKKAKASAKAQFCRNPEFIRALNYFSFDFYYVDTKRKPLYAFTLTKNDC
jgi:hypothetical protein